MLRLVIPLAASLALSLAAAAPAVAQETSGIIRGVIIDQTGAVLGGVKITATNVATSRTREVSSDRQGLYVVALPVGEYDLAFRRDGFRPLTFRRVAVHVNDRLQRDATLLVGIEAAIEVRAETLPQRTSMTQTLLRPNDLQQLPLLNRHFVQLVPLVPGVSSGLVDELTFCLRDDLWISINGARRSAVNWLLDGASNVDVGTNATLLATSSLDAIQEVKVITSNPTAEWARSGGGGVVHVVTRSGTSQFAGTAFEFFRHDALNAAPVDLFPEQTGPSVRVEPPRLRYSNFGATLGGPALPSRKDLFFFMSTEWRRVSRESVVGTFEVPDPVWLTDPASPHYVLPAERDPVAVKMLSLWPAPNVPGQNRFRTVVPTPDHTRQQVVRVDHDVRPGWMWTARLIFDNNQFVEPSSFFNAASDIDVTGRVGVVQLQSAKGRWWNELSYAFAGRRLSTTNPRLNALTRGAMGVEIPEVFSGNRADLLPGIDITAGSTRLARSRAFQPSDVEYGAHTVADHFTLARGAHTIKIGGLATRERRTDLAGRGVTQGLFVFISTAGATAFQNFMRGRSFLYFEDDLDLTNDFRFGRYEAYVQDTWSRRRLTLDMGLRYSIYTPVKDTQGRLTTFSPAAFDPQRTDQMNGVIVAESPEKALYRVDTNNFQPRLAASWDVRGDGTSIARAAYGVYFDQPQTGIFRADYSDDALIQQATIRNAPLSDPRLGQRDPPFPFPPPRHAVSQSFTTPRMQQWSLGLQRQLYRSGVVDVSYVGSRGDQLIRPIDINRPPLQAFYGEDVPSPYPGHDAIISLQSTGRSRYKGLLASFRHRGGPGTSVVVNYTLSRSQTDATEDNNFEADQPQDPLNLAAEFTDARTDRRHIFTTYFSYDLPFFRNSSSRGWRAVVAGWQLAGIGTITSGPAARILVPLAIGPLGVTGIRPNQIGDPGAGDQDGLWWFDPAVFTPPTPGSYGTAPVAPFRLPGRHQWDLSISKTVNLGATGLQVRADVINAFNQTQFLQVNTSCVGRTGCAEFNRNFGRAMSARAPRQIQMGLRLSW